jgi:hypothetical protein
MPTWAWILIVIAALLIVASGRTRRLPSWTIPGPPSRTPTA